jgi:hypothetical protein
MTITDLADPSIVYDFKQVAPALLLSSSASNSVTVSIPTQGTFNYFVTASNSAGQVDSLQISQVIAYGTSPAIVFNGPGDGVVGEAFGTQTAEFTVYKTLATNYLYTISNTDLMSISPNFILKITVTHVGIYGNISFIAFTSAVKTNSSTAGNGYIDSLFSFAFTNTNEFGTELANITGPGIPTFVHGDVIFIERSGSLVYFKVNGVLGRTWDLSITGITSIYLSMWLAAGNYSTNPTVLTLEYT